MLPFSPYAMSRLSLPSPPNHRFSTFLTQRYPPSTPRQSVALRMVCEREAEIERFRSQEYWTISARLSAFPDGAPFEARLTHADGARLAPLAIGDAAAAAALAARVRGAEGWAIASATRRPGKRQPPAPFTTSSLQQEAARRLGWGAAKTMSVAQRLYEGESAGASRE